MSFWVSVGESSEQAWGSENTWGENSDGVVWGSGNTSDGEKGIAKKLSQSLKGAICSDWGGTPLEHDLFLTWGDGTRHGVRGGIQAKAYVERESDCSGKGLCGARELLDWLITEGQKRGAFLSVQQANEQNQVGRSSTCS